MMSNIFANKTSDIAINAQEIALSDIKLDAITANKVNNRTYVLLVYSNDNFYSATSYTISSNLKTLTGQYINHRQKANIII